MGNSNNQELRISIVSDADTKGFKEAAASGEKLEATTKNLGNVRGVEDLTGQIGGLDDAVKKATNSNDGLSDSEKAGAASAEFMHKNHRELHELFGEMGRQSAPALGRAMTGMMMGPLGPALTLLTVIGALKSAFDGWQENLDQAADSNASANFGKGIDDMNTALENGRSDLEAYKDDIAEIAKHEVTIAQALASQLALMRAIAAEREKEIKAREAAATAEAARKEKAGELTPEEAEIKRTKAAIDSAKGEVARQQQDRADEITKTQKAIDDGNAEQKGLDADTAAKKAVVTKETAHRNSVGAFGPESDQTVVTWDGQSELDKALGVTGETTKTQKRDDAIKTATGEVDKWQETVDWLTKANAKPDTLVTDAQVNDARQILAQAQGQLNNLMRGRTQYDQANSGTAEDKFKADQRAADEAEKKGKANASDVDAETRRINDLRANDAALKPGEDKELADKIAAILSEAMEKFSDLPHGAEIAQGIKFSDDIEKAIRAAALGDQYQRTQKITDEDARFLMKFVNEHGGNAQTVDQSSQYAVNQWGNLQAHDTTEINDQNKSQFNLAEQYLVELANNLGAHVNNVKAAADFVITLKDNTSGFLDAISQVTANGFTAQQKQLDALFVIVERIQADSTHRVN